MTIQKFKEYLIISGIDVACKKMGYHFEEMFLPPCSNENIPYADYYWCVYTTTVDGIEPNIYIHAIPPQHVSDHLPWEEWFVMNGIFEHHVCYSKPMSKTTNIVHIPWDDPDHPLYTIDKTWYWYVDPDITPVLYRKTK